MPKLRTIFAGSPAFAADILKGLLDTPYAPVAVLTQPDRPRGRGKKLAPSAVKSVAQAHEIEVYQPPSLRDGDAAERLTALAPEVLLVAAYGLILPPKILKIPSYGCLNVHASLLPRWRGAAPIERAVMAGDTKTGVCIMHMEKGLDTGPVYARAELPITASTDIGELERDLASLGVETLAGVLKDLKRARDQGVSAEEFLKRAEPQAEQGITYADKLTSAEIEVDWRDSAEVISRKIQALAQRQPVRVRLGDIGVRLLAANAVLQTMSDSAPPAGTLIDANKQALSIQCATDILQITKLKVEKGKGAVLDPAAAINGFKHLFQPGVRFE